MLEFVDRLRIEQVLFAFAPVAILTAAFELLFTDSAIRKSLLLSHPDLFGYNIKADSTNSRRCPGEVAIDKILIETDRLEHLRAAIALNSRDTHLGNNFHHAFVNGPGEIPDGLLTFHSGEPAVADQVVNAFEREIRIDCCRPVSDQQSEVMHLARLAALDHETDLGARPLTDQMMMNGGYREQGRNRSLIARDSTIRENNDAVSRRYGFACPAAKMVQCVLETAPAFHRREQH